MKVEYKPIEGFDNYYVCNSGVNEQTVLSTINEHGGVRLKWLKPWLRNGYYCVSLFKGGKGYTKYVHRLVADVFIQKKDGNDFIDHIDGDRTNNTTENLRWCTQKENSNNPITKKRMSVAQSKPVNQYTKEGEFIASYPSSMEASRHTAINQSNISQCCLGKYKTVGGYKWRYAS